MVEKQKCLLHNRVLARVFTRVIMSQSTGARQGQAKGTCQGQALGTAQGQGCDEEPYNKGYEGLEEAKSVNKGEDREA